jgi:hypothetical protein
MEEFTQERPGEDQMHWEIHIHGLDTHVVQRYRVLYRDSVITPITAMPVARYSNKERKKFCFEGLSSILSTCKRSKRRENDTHATFGSDEHDMVPSWLSMRVGSRNRGTSSGT